MLARTQQYLFSRAYQLTIGPDTGGAAARYGNIGGTSSALRITFEVNKIAAGAANKATIALYNVNVKTRAALVRGYQVVLDAGYQGLVERLFTGTVFKATSSRSGPDIVTSLECIDGLRPLLYSTFSRTYPKRTTLAQVLGDVAQASEALAGTVMGIPPKVYARGLSVHGTCRDILEELCRPHGLEVSITNGKLNILPKGAHLGTQAIVLSPQTGLLGVPSISQTSVSFEALLNPKLIPGQRVQLVTANPNTCGIMYIRSCKMTGDTHGQAWQVAAEGVRETTVTSNLKAATGFDFGQAVVPGLL